MDKTVYSEAMKMYDEGDYVHALSAFRNSLELGNERSAYGLALCMYHGHGMFVDKSSARQLVEGYFPRIAAYAERGDAEAQQVLGLYYSDGVFAERDGERAREWLSKPAAQGHRPSKMLLKRL